MTKCNSMLVSRSILARPISILSILVIFIVLSLLSNLYILSEEIAKHQHNIRHYNHHNHRNHHRNLDYFELAEKISSNQNLYDYNEPNAEQKNAMISCPSCFLRLEQLKFLNSDNIRLEAIKQQILLKLGLKAKPNVTHNLSKKVIMDTLSRYENDIFLSRKHVSSSSSSFASTAAASTSSFFEAKNTSSRNGGGHHQHHHRTDRNRESFGDRAGTKSNDQQDDTNQFEPSKIIAFAEKGGSMNGNKILEFSISNGHGSKVVSAHLWLKIEKNANENTNPETGKSADEGNSEQSDDDESDTDDDTESERSTNRGRSRGRGRVMAPRKRTRGQRVSSTNRNDDNGDQKTASSSSSRSSFCKPKLWVFKVSENADTDTFIDHQRVSSKTFERITELVASRAIDLDLIAADTNWYKFNVTDAVRDWDKMTKPVSTHTQPLRHNEYLTATTTITASVPEHTKLRLLVDCSGCCHQIYVHRFQDSETASAPSAAETTTGPGGNKNRPYLVIETKSTSTSRKRRRAIDCNSANKGQCCKQRFYVNFKQLGWDDWVIAPSGYFANYCRGDCDENHRTPDMFRNYYTHVIEEIRKKHELSGMQPCCAPVRFSSMSLIYFGPDNNIIKRDLPKMIVEECGCP